MRRPLTLLEQRVSAVLLLGVAMALIYWGMVEPWLVAPHQAISEQMADVRQAQRRYVALLGQREALQAQVAAMQPGDVSENGLLPGDDASGASAALLQRGAEVIAQHQGDGAGCELLNRTPLTDTPGAGPYPQVQASFNLTCAIEPIEAIVYDLETGTPALFVSQLRIERPAQAADGPGARLEVQLTVSGFAHTQASPNAGREEAL